MKDFMAIADELIREAKEIADELIEEEILPLIKHQKEEEDKAFEKAYTEVKELEEI